MRRIPALSIRRGLPLSCPSVCFLLVALVAAPQEARAQTDRVDRGGFSVEVARGLGFEVIGASILVDRRMILRDDPPTEGRFADAEPSVTTFYSERATSPLELAGAFRWSLGGSLALTARLRSGSSDTESSFAGAGGPPEVFVRALRWTGLDLTASFPLAAWERWQITGSAGADRTWWTLDTRGMGRQELVRQATLDQDAPPVPWSERSWATLGMVFGMDLEYLATPEWAASVRLQHRVSRPRAGVLASAIEDDIRTGTGNEDVRVATSGARHTLMAPSAALSLAWRPLVRRVTDPAPGVLSTRARREVREAAEPDPRDSLSPAFHDAMERSDTLAAIQVLEEALTASEEGETEAVVIGELGILLAYTAPLEELDFTQRERAAELLERALKLDPGNPRYFLALGVVYDKALLRGDARLAVNRGLEAAEEHPARVSDRELADAFYRRGHTLEEWVKEFEDLKNVPADQAQLGTVGCQVIGDAFCLNWDRPRRFFDHFQFFPDLSDIVDDDRALMLREYERAVSIAPTHDGAWRGILRARARTRDWNGLLEDARRWSEAHGENPWSRIMLGVALIKAEEDWGAAEALFQEALFELGQDDRSVFLNLRPLLRNDEEDQWAAWGPVEQNAYREAYFKAQDPLYLSPANERRAAHYARVALAELIFGEPQSGRRGWETDRGQILVRYGLPETRWMVRRDDRRILRTQGLEGAPTAGDMGGGRWIFWNYDPDAPSFVFEKKLGRASVHHMASSHSIFMARDLKADQPTSFPAPFRALDPMPVQMALFRSATGRSHELEVHALVPGSELVAGTGADSVDAGFFLNRTRNWNQEAEAGTRQSAGDPELDFRIRRLGPGIYRYSLEAADPERRAASVARGELSVRGTSGSGLALSDLLLARDVVPTVAEPAARRDLSVDPLRCLAVPADGSVWVVFEAYGLTARDGTKRYRIDVVTEGEEGNPILGFLRGLASPVLGEPEDRGPGRISYERSVEARGDRVLEWFRIQLPETVEEEVSLRVRLSDLRSEAEVEGVRMLAAGGCPGIAGPGASGGEG